LTWDEMASMKLSLLMMISWWDLMIYIEEKSTLSLSWFCLSYSSPIQRMKGIWFFRACYICLLVLGFSR